MFSSRWYHCSTATCTILQMLLAQLCHGTILQQLLVLLFSSHWHGCSTVACTTVKQFLARFFKQSLVQLINSRWHYFSKVDGTIVQQSLAQFLNSHWHNCLTFSGTNLLQISQKIKFSIKDFCSKMWPNPQEIVDFVTFTKEILNGKLCFLCNDSCWHDSLIVTGGIPFHGIFL